MARMSAAHLASQGGGYEPQRAYEYEIQLYGVPGAEVIKLACDSFQPPEATEDTITLGYLNEKIKVAGQGSWGDASLVVRDMVDMPIWSSLMAWYKLKQDPTTGNQGYASSYKKQGELVLLGPDGGAERRYKLVGVYPKTIRGEQLSGNSGGEIYKITVTLSVDKAIPLF